MAEMNAYAELGAYYRKHLLEDVMPFWETRTKDTECGGYLTCFDREGNVTDTDKYIWFQGRQFYMFSALYRQVEQRAQWLDLATHGREFLLKHAYAGNGRWHYQLDRAGGVKQATISFYSDHFLLEGMCQYALATGRDDDMELINDTFDAIERNTRDPQFKDIYHGTWKANYRRHGVSMFGLHAARQARPILGDQRVRELADYCLNQTLYVFAKDEYKTQFESIGSDDNAVMDEDEGRVVNPGHTLEGMWFCIEEGLDRNDQGIIDRALTVADWAYDQGYDRGYGGIVAFLDASGEEPKQMDWHKETNMMWHDKPWWVHSESLYTLALAAVLRGNPGDPGNPGDMDRFMDLHDWCRRHFYDPEFGEWYPELYRDGSPKLTDKGTLWKAAYHLPRALMKLMQLFESRR